MRNSKVTNSSRTWLAPLALLLLFSASGCGFSWWESYRYDKKEPYDLYALYELLEAREGGLILNRDTLAGLEVDTNVVNNYLYVGTDIFLSESDVTGLLNFVEAGNKAFLITKNLPEDVNYHLFGPDCFYYGGSYNNQLAYYFEDSIGLSLTNQLLLDQDSLMLQFVYDHQAVNHGWMHVPPDWLCDPGFGNEVLGTINDSLVNFVRLRYGEGELLLHTSPELFTNYYLTDSSRYTYAQAVLSYLGDGPVYWDEYARSYTPDRAGQNNQAQNPYGGRTLLNDNHALRYVLEQPPLALAWYLLVVGGLLYVLFRGKRRQRIIPVHSPPENSSRQFVDTIARLAYQHGNHAELAKRELIMLRQFLAERYNLHWAEDESVPKDLALRLGLSQETVDHALKQIRFVSNRDHLEVGDLQLFYRAIDPIYRL
jgi:hypothetical protein